jgi:hypothetical protein
MYLGLRYGKQRGWLESTKYRSRYGVVFDAYAPSWYWWQFLILMRRSALVGAAVVFYRDRTAKLSWITFLNILFLITHMLARPYQTDRNNNMETVSLGLLSLLSSVLTTVGENLDIGEIIGMSFLTIIPIVGFAGITIHARLARVKTVVSNLWKGRSLNTTPTNGHNDLSSPSGSSAISLASSPTRDHLLQSPHDTPTPTGHMHDNGHHDGNGNGFGNDAAGITNSSRSLNDGMIIDSSSDTISSSDIAMMPLSTLHTSSGVAIIDPSSSSPPPRTGVTSITEADHDASLTTLPSSSTSAVTSISMTSAESVTST